MQSGVASVQSGCQSWRSQTKDLLIRELAIAVGIDALKLLEDEVNRVKIDFLESQELENDELSSVDGFIDRTPFPRTIWTALDFFLAPGL